METAPTSFITPLTVEDLIKARLLATQVEQPMQPVVEYDAAGSEDLTTEIPRVSPEAQNKTDTEKAEELAALEDAANAAREEFARRSAGRASRIFHVKKEYRSNSVDGTRMRYNIARDKLLKFKSKLEEDKMTRQPGNAPGAGAREIDERVKWSKLEDILSEQRLLAETVLSSGNFNSPAQAQDLRDRLYEAIKKQEARVKEARKEALSEGINLNINIPGIGGKITGRANKVIEKRREPIIKLGKTAVYGGAAWGGLRILEGIFAGI